MEYNRKQNLKADGRSANSDKSNRIVTIDREVSTRFETKLNKYGKALRTQDNIVTALEERIERLEPKIRKLNGEMRIETNKDVIRHKSLTETKESFENLDTDLMKEYVSLVGGPHHTFYKQ